MFYNFSRIHQTLRVSPAMEVEIADYVDRQGSKFLLEAHSKLRGNTPKRSQEGTGSNKSSKNLVLTILYAWSQMHSASSPSTESMTTTVLPVPNLTRSPLFNLPPYPTVRSPSIFWRVWSSWRVWLS